MDTEIIYKISEHCKNRYAERILNKSDVVEIKRFIIENEDKIQTDINKLITYREKVYAGKQSQKDGKGKVLDVYIKDLWVILVDTQSQIVVTMYKIDLGLGDEFNKEYVAKYMEKIESLKSELNSVQLKVSEESNVYREMINDAQEQIKQYKSFINNLEVLCSSYQNIIDNNVVKVSQANRDVADTVNKLMGKKEF